MSELKPCPFCGCLGEDLVSDQIGVTHECCGFVEWNDWNTRPIEDALRAEVAGLKEVLAQVQAWREKCPYGADSVADTVMFFDDEFDELDSILRTVPKPLAVETIRSIVNPHGESVLPRHWILLPNGTPPQDITVAVWRREVEG